MFRLPGHSYRGSFLPLTDAELVVRKALLQHVQILAGEIGERNIHRPRALAEAAEYVERQFVETGHPPSSQEFPASSRTVRNVEVERAGSTDEILVIGAHYDSVIGSPGANDNATGTAAVLELSRLLAALSMKRTVRFVMFVNEEPPYFMTDLMGSLVYARRCREHDEKIVGMFSLETIGYYSNERGSQQYPGPAVFRMLYPERGISSGSCRTCDHAAFCAPPHGRSDVPRSFLLKGPQYHPLSRASDGPIIGHSGSKDTRQS